MSDEIAHIAAATPPWRQHLVGQARCEAGRTSLRLVVKPTARAYSDAQIDDYQLTGRQPLLRRPPLRLRLLARLSHPANELRGTAGFGFWNYPFVRPRAPRAVWFFFGSPPGDMPLALGVPGHGCKAATVDTGRPRALALLPLAPLLVPLFWVPPLFRGLYPPIQRAVGVAEAMVRGPLEQWHEYVIEWGERTSRFLVDGRVLLDEAPSPRGPLCFVAWIDNQYLVLTPQGRVGWGLLAAPGPQWLELAGLRIEDL